MLIDSGESIRESRMMLCHRGTIYCTAPFLRLALFGVYLGWEGVVIIIGIEKIKGLERCDSIDVKAGYYWPIDR